MNPFRRAYRDPKSPLTPLTPLASNAAFSFNIGGDDSLKPFIEAILTKKPSKTSPVRSTGEVKYVNPSKYINHRSTNLNAHNDAITKNETKARKLSPRFASTKKTELQAKCFNNEPVNGIQFDMNNVSMSASKLTSKYSAIFSTPTTCSTSLTSNTASFEETTYFSASNQQSSACSSTSYNVQSEINSQHIPYDCRTPNSNFSSDSNTSFVSSSSSYSTSNKLGADNRYRKPPKIVLDDTMGDESVATMSSVFNWVCNRLSPMKNPSIYELLACVDMQKYWKIFKREEILDLDVFSSLTLEDLKAIGIKDTDDCVKILKCVGMALDFLSGLFVLKKP